MNAKQMLEEEKALEEKLFGTPSDGSSNSPEATTAKPEDNSALTPEEGTDTQTPEPAKPEVKPEEDWEKRYKNLRASREQKLYDAQKNLADNQAQLVSLQERLAELESQVDKPKDVTVGDVLSDEEREALGDTAVQAFDKAAKAIADSRTQSLEKELAEIRERNKEQAKKQVELDKQEAYATFTQRLTQAVPDWPELNKDQNFVKYLDHLDIDGNTRLENLRQAERRGDVAGVARFMLDYKAQSKPENPLDDMITPTATTATPTPKQEVDYLTMAQIDAHYKKHERGGYKSHKEFLEMERKIDEYAAAGRIKR